MKLKILVGTMTSTADYVAQECIVPSVSPGLGPNGLEPQPILLRVQLVADGEDYVVMPGGVARLPSRMV